VAASADFARKAGDASWLGNIIMFTAACAGALYNVASRPVLRRNSAVAVIGYGMTAGSLVLAAILLSLGRFGGIWKLNIDQSGWVILLATGTLGAALAFYLLIWALKRTTPTKVAVFLSLNPVVAMLLGSVALGEPVTATQLGGLVLVVAGIAMVNWTGPWIAARR
jgi:drug/metabolite transporter (DMT)-like permease